MVARTGDESLVDARCDAFHPLGIGRRNCIGKGFGLLEARLVVVKLLWSLDMSAGEEDWDWTTSQKSYFVWDRRALYVSLTPAKH